MEFIAPTPARASARSQHWIDVVEATRSLKPTPENPDCWVLAGNYSTGVADHIRKGLFPAFIPEGTPDPQRYMEEHYEVTTRSKVAGRCNIHIRWKG